MIPRLVAHITAVIPQQWKKTLSGSYQRPSHLGQLIHTFLNRLPVERFPVMTCSGVLQPYRMKIDWHRHRSFIYGTWEPDIVQVIKREVSAGMVALDVGSHIGFYTLLLARLVEPHGQVVAFEPLPQNFKLLVENLQLNHLQHVQPINKAVTDHSGTVELHLDESNPLPGESTIMSGGCRGGATITVAGTTLDEYVADLGKPVSFIKIDVEGAEELVLRGALQTIEQYYLTLLVELHAFNKPEDHPVIALLEAYNYQIQWVDNLTITAHILATYRGAMRSFQ